MLNASWRRFASTTTKTHSPRGYRALKPRDTKFRASRDSLGRPVKVKAPVISTLDPTKLLPTDYLDLSDISWQNFHTSTSISASYHADHYKAAPFTYYGTCNVDGKPQHEPFPPGTQGFFYYHPVTPSNFSHMGEIRFRCAPPSSPSSDKPHDAFMLGKDLLKPTGLPWSIHLFCVAAYPLWSALREQLIVEGLVPKEDMDLYKRLMEKSKVTRRSVVLNYLDQPFHINFNATRFTLWTADSEACYEHKFNQPFRDSRREYLSVVYRGSGLVRLEKMGSALGLRVLKITNPVEKIFPQYDEYLHPPVEGRFITRGYRIGHSSKLVSLVSMHTDKLLALPSSSAISVPQPSPPKPPSSSRPRPKSKPMALSPSAEVTRRSTPHDVRRLPREREAFVPRYPPT